MRDDEAAMTTASTSGSASSASGGVDAAAEPGGQVGGGSGRASATATRSGPGTWWPEQGRVRGADPAAADDADPHRVGVGGSVSDMACESLQADHVDVA